MKIYLLGMPGSGKTTTGKLLASELNFDFVDMDLEIEKEMGKPITEIFEAEGEKQFRFLETQLLKMLAERDSLVIATGGGVPLHNNNMELISQTGISIYLKTNSEQLISNLKDTSFKRPLLKGKDLPSAVAGLLREREPVYLQSRHIIETGPNPEDSVRKIVEIIKS